MSFAIPHRTIVWPAAILACCMFVAPVSNAQQVREIQRAILLPQVAVPVAEVQVGVVEAVAEAKDAAAEVKEAIDGAKDEKSTKESKEAEAKAIEAAYKGFNPLKTEGPMNKISEPLAKVAVLKWEGRKLVADIPETYQDVNEAVTEIRRASSGGGGGHGSTNYWVQSFYGQEMSGMLSRGMQNRGGAKKDDADDPFQVRVLEMIKRGREMVFSGDNMNEFNVLISGGEDPWMFHFKQLPGGKVSVHEIAGDEVFSASSDNFETFCRENADYVQTRLVPVLKLHGVRPPVTRFNPVAREQVLAAISPLDPKREAEFKKTFSGLDSGDYDEREATSKTLEAEYEQWKDVVRRVMNDPDYSFETRSRLSKLVKSKSTEEDRELLDMVSSSKLAEDADYLIWLLESAEPSVAADITQQLTRITGQDFKDDLAKWQAWNQEQQPESKTTVEPLPFTRLAESDGFIQKMALPISDLIRFDLKEDKLILNREEWAKQFNGKTIKELVAATRKEVEERNLPANWFNPQVSQQDDQADYAQVLFQKIQTAVPTGSNRHYYGYNNMYAYHNSQMNKHFEQPHLSGVLSLQPNRDQKDRTQKIGSKPMLFRFSIHENEGSEQFMQVFEAPDKSLTVKIVSRQANSMLQVHQSPTGPCSLRLIQGDNASSADADNFKALLEENEKLFNEEVLPAFAHYGLQVSENMGGPLKIENQKPEKK